MNASFGPFLVILLGLGFGIFLRRTGHLPHSAPKVLNAYVISVAVPALVLAQLPRFLMNLGNHPEKLSGALFFLPLVPWFIFIGSIFFFRAFYRRGLLTREEWGLLVLAGGLGNTAFVGFPLIEALLGKDNLPPAILLDQLGTFLAISMGGTLWVTALSERSSTGAPVLQWRKFLGELFRFPPFVALLASFIVSVWGGFPPALEGVIEHFSSTLVPVAMVSVGAQLRLDRAIFRKNYRSVLLGLGYKMVLAPIVIAGLCVAARFFLTGLNGDLFSVAVLEAAMAPMITSTVLGIEAGFAPELGALMLGIGIPLSLVSVPFIHFLIRFGTTVFPTSM